MSDKKYVYDKMLKNFEYMHLPEHLTLISVDFYKLAVNMASRDKDSGYNNIAETMAGLRKLLEAKDCAVRVGVQCNI